MPLEFIDSDIERDEKGWKETTTYKAYYLDRETGQVTCAETDDCDNPYKPVNQYKDNETATRVLKDNEIPHHIRAKVKELMKVTK